MDDGPGILKSRLNWVRLYAESGDAGLVCRRCGISRPTLRKWWRRYNALGEAGLRSKSRCPHSSPLRKITSHMEEWVLELRRKRKLGPRRIRAELLRLHDCRLSTASIWKILKRHEVKLLRRRRLARDAVRFNKPIPGEMVQLDSCKIAPGLYQFTAVDDCTRYRVLGLYKRRSTRAAVHFLTERMIEEFPFPIQRVQTDRGSEFFGAAFQEALRENCIKFRPVRPGAPHLTERESGAVPTD
jgi:transposase InsO family protein